MTTMGDDGLLHAKATPNACIQCRRVKMKCLFRDGHSVCERCTRLSIDCVRVKHRRGRKLGTRLTRSGPRPPAPSGNTLLADDTDNDTDVPCPPPPPASETVHAPGTWVHADGFQPRDLLHKREAKGRFSLEIVLNTDAVSPPVDRPCGRDAGSASRVEQVMTDPVDLGILNRHIAVLLFDEFMNKLNMWICQFDPVLHTFEYVQRRSALLFTAILTAAAQAFHPALCQSLRAHTEALLARSFSQGDKSIDVVHAILVTISWKRPEDTRTWMLVGFAIRMAYELGWHEVVWHGLAASTEARSTAARRHGQGQDGNCSNSEARPRPPAPETPQQHAQRVRRDVERTWLLLFVCDRSLGFQTGSPWMIERSEFLLTARDVWWLDPLATPTDGALCALVDLRLLTSDTFRPSHPKHHRGASAGMGAGADTAQVERHGALVRSLLQDVDAWHNRWMRVADADAASRAPHACLPFFVRFYSAHLRLLLSSSPLELSLALATSSDRRVVDKRALWLAFTSAIDMLKALNSTDIQTCLYFAHDSIHVELAYAAAFLLKLCLQLPRDMSGEFVGIILASLQQASTLFQTQAAPPNTGCALQASFLINILLVFERSMRGRAAAPPPVPVWPSSDDTNTTARPGPRQRTEEDMSSASASASEPASAAYPVLRPNVQRTAHNKGIPSDVAARNISSIHAITNPDDRLLFPSSETSSGERQAETASMTMPLSTPVTVVVTGPGYDNDIRNDAAETRLYSLSADLATTAALSPSYVAFDDGNLPLFDEDMWMNMLNEAGFSLSSGTFLQASLG